MLFCLWLLAFDSLNMVPVVSRRTSCFPPQKGQIGGCKCLRPEGEGGNWLHPKRHSLGFLDFKESQRQNEYFNSVSETDVT